MFTTGIPLMSLSFFSAASMAVSLPSGIQVFAWIATIAAGRLRFATPSLFVLGFLFIFTLGGLTGVMVAMVPFDWQAHDTYFVVAHFHYVLVGGMVFPLFAALYYWAPAFSRHALSERLGSWAFWLMFVGFNVAFLPMHLTGLMGMPRRVYTYPAELGWGTLNAISTRRRLHLRRGRARLHRRPGAALPARRCRMRREMSGMPARWNGSTTMPMPRAAFRASPTAIRCGAIRRLEKAVDAAAGICPARRPARAKPSSPRRSKASRNICMRLPAPAWRTCWRRSSPPRSS